MEPEEEPMGEEHLPAAEPALQGVPHQLPGEGVDCRPDSQQHPLPVLVLGLVPGLVQDTRWKEGFLETWSSFMALIAD